MFPSPLGVMKRERQLSLRAQRILVISSRHHLNGEISCLKVEYIVAEKPETEPRVPSSQMCNSPKNLLVPFIKVRTLHDCF